MTKDQRIHVSLRPEETIVVTVAELSQIFKCDSRTVSKLSTAGILVRLPGHGKFDLLPSVSNYVMHLRRVASGLTTADAKVLALTSLTNLRDVQREAIERKSKDYALVEDVKKVFRIAANAAREQILQLPVRLRRKVEDNHPSLIASRAEAVKLEEDIEDVVFSVMDAIAESEPTAYWPEPEIAA